MDRQTAEKFLRIVNDPLYATWKEYANHRISVLKDELVMATELDDIRRLQGAIRELKRFETLKDSVEQAGKRDV